MTAVRLGPFMGANTATRPKLLDNNMGVMSLNHRDERGDLRPWSVPLAHTTIGASKKTIFMLPREATSDTIYWLEWGTVVHAVRSFRNSDPTKRVYYSGSGPPKATDNILALAGAPYPTSYRDLGIPKPLTLPLLTQTAAGTGDDETRYYAYTYVSDWDEEGPPAVSAVVTCKPGALFDITNLAAPPSGAGETRGINRIRIYRTASGETGAAFFFLREITVATSTTDDARAVGVDTLPSTNYAMPPSDMKGLTGLWNGMMAGISGNAVRYCEPFKPHAWPAAYETLCADTPIALAVFEKNLLIVTTARPRLVYGTSPEAMDDTPVEFIAACVSVTSVVAMGHGACWATSRGLAYVGRGGPRILTEGLITPEQWKALNPSSMVAAQYEGKYFCFYDLGGGNWDGFCIDPLQPDAGIRYFSDGYQAVYYDALGEDLYVLNGTSVQRWNAGVTKMTASFRSKVWRMPAPLNMAWAEVIADTYPCTFTLFADARTPWVKTVTSKDPFQLPSGYVADDYQIEVSTATDITGVVMAESLAEIASS